MIAKRFAFEQPLLAVSLKKFIFSFGKMNFFKTTINGQPSTDNHQRTTINGQPTYGSQLSLPKSGLRFSRNAFLPSFASSVI